MTFPSSITTFFLVAFLIVALLSRKKNATVAIVNLSSQSNDKKEHERSRAAHQATHSAYTTPSSLSQYSRLLRLPGELGFARRTTTSTTRRVQQERSLGSRRLGSCVIIILMTSALVCGVEHSFRFLWCDLTISTGCWRMKARAC